LHPVLQEEQSVSLRTLENICSNAPQLPRADGRTMRRAAPEATAHASLYICTYMLLSLELSPELSPKHMDLAFALSMPLAW
jgi:hypothetical protein